MASTRSANSPQIVQPGSALVNDAQSTCESVCAGQAHFPAGPGRINVNQLTAESFPWYY